MKKGLAYLVLLWVDQGNNRSTFHSNTLCNIVSRLDLMELLGDGSLYRTMRPSHYNFLRESKQFLK